MDPPHYFIGLFCRPSSLTALAYSKLCYTLAVSLPHLPVTAVNNLRLHKRKKKKKMNKQKKKKCCMPIAGSKGNAEATSGSRQRGFVSSQLRAIWTRVVPRGDNHTELWWDKLRSRRSLAAVMEEGSDAVSPWDQMWQIESRTWRRRRRCWLVSHHDGLHPIGRRAQTMARREGPTHRDDYSNTHTHPHDVRLSLSLF